jgi:hypothetical protein
VVALFGLAEQVSPLLATCWQADRLAYWQFSAPLAPLMQNLPLPIVFTEPLGKPLPGAVGDFGDMVPCAPAIERPAANAAMVVKVASVFNIISSLRIKAAKRHAPTTDATKGRSGNSTDDAKKFGMRRRRGERVVDA